MIISASGATTFSIFYAILTTGFFFQFKEFSGIGLSPENLLSPWLGDFNTEGITFFEYHVQKTASTLVLHFSLPLVYLLGLTLSVVFVDKSYASVNDFVARTPWFTYALTIALALPLAAYLKVLFWRLSKWDNHPFIRKVLPYARNSGLWQDVARDINTEFRRIDKLIIQVSPTSRVIVTDNWILVVGQWPWQFQLAHQSDVELRLVDSEHHRISPDGVVGGSQFLFINVYTRKPGCRGFRIRVNSLEYQNLQDKIRGPIANVRNLAIFKTVSEQFVEVFREEVERNPKVDTDEELESCIGCMVNPSNVRLVRRCAGLGVEQGEDPCVTCYCRPMWCIDCLGKWFASRQNENATDTWLAARCPCPTCRSKFCVLDVSLINNMP